MITSFKKLIGLRAPRAEDGANRRAAARVKDWAREELALGEDDAVSVNEIECEGACCPEVETVILVMRIGRKTVSYKLPGSVARASREDVAAAIRRASGDRPALGARAP